MPEKKTGVVKGISSVREFSKPNKNGKITTLYKLAINIDSVEYSAVSIDRSVLTKIASGIKDKDFVEFVPIKNGIYNNFDISAGVKRLDTPAPVAEQLKSNNERVELMRSCLTDAEILAQEFGLSKPELQDMATTFFIQAKREGK